MYTVQVVYTHGREEEFHHINRMRISADEIVLFRDGGLIETLQVQDVESFDFESEGSSH